MRPPSACIACRERRKRCKRPRQESNCYFCIKRGLRCILERSQSGADNVTPGPTNYELLEDCRQGNGFQISPSLHISLELALELADLYFRYIHVAFHDLFHKSSFETAITTGMLPKILLLAVAGLSARFSAHPSLAGTPSRERGRAFRKEAEKLINLYSVSLTTIQACAAVAAALVIEGDANTESIFLNVACRMALLMDLPNAPANTRIEQELHIRVWWTLIATDTWSSGALQVPKAMPFRQGIPTPMSELAFATLDLDEPAGSSGFSSTSASPAPQPSIFASKVELNQLLHRILTLNSQVMSDPSEVDIISESSKLCDSLDSWYGQLPAALLYTPENHLQWAQQGCGRMFTIFHINYNYAGQLLFFRFLYQSHDKDDIPATDSRRVYAERCKTHASQLCELIQRAMRTPGSDVNYPLMAHTIVVASTIQLYILLFSPDEVEIAKAKTRLEQSFSLLNQLQEYWPNLDTSIDKFKTFHLACMNGQADVFRMDRWLLRFMIDYARPATAREDNFGRGHEEL